MSVMNNIKKTKKIGCCKFFVRPDLTNRFSFLLDAVLQFTKRGSGAVACHIFKCSAVVLRLANELNVSENSG